MQRLARPCYILTQHKEEPAMHDFHLPPSTRIAYAHLRVADLERSLLFYRDLLGFKEIDREGLTVRLSATGALPPEIILTGHPGAQPKPPRTTGLYHIAIRLPTRPALARVLRRLLEGGWPLHGAADHLVSEALYLPDPDGNGLELYTDRPREQWAWDGDQVAMATEALDVEGLLAEANGSGPWTGIDPATDVGHVHLHVSDLKRAEAFYSDLLGFDVTQRAYPGALFVAAGGYHHHIGLNTWAGRGAPPPPPDAAGLVAFGICLPDLETWRSIVGRARELGVSVEEQDGEGNLASALLRDSDLNAVVLLTSAC
jgi:catechol 2,3-dioxygenase